MFCVGLWLPRSVLCAWFKTQKLPANLLVCCAATLRDKGANGGAYENVGTGSLRLVIPPEGVNTTRVDQILLHRENAASNVVSFDAEHLVHMYTRMQMLPMLEAAAGGVIFIDHADKIISDGFDPVGKFAFKAMIEQIRWLSNNQTVCILGVSRSGKAKVERAEPSATALFSFSLNLPDYTPEQLSKLAAHIIDQSGYVFPCCSVARVLKECYSLYAPQYV